MRINGVGTLGGGEFCRWYRVDDGGGGRWKRRPGVDGYLRPVANRWTEALSLSAGAA